MLYNASHQAFDVAGFTFEARIQSLEVFHYCVGMGDQMAVYNNRTGALICEETAVYGQGGGGKFDEPGCVEGSLAIIKTGVKRYNHAYIARVLPDKSRPRGGFILAEPLVRTGGAMVPFCTRVSARMNPPLCRDSFGSVH